ncbi:MAG: hypothetical protein HUN04_04410 [Desulfobacter sp.]|nr:MAG: hypothetical protein HUN04_04410 [Desulfobacter sp.]
MADEVPAQNPINILLIAPHGVEDPPLDDINTAQLTCYIKDHLGCDAIINMEYRKPTGSKKEKRNNRIPSVKAKVLDLNKVHQAKQHPTFIQEIKDVVEKDGTTYVFWIHGIHNDHIKKGIDCYIGCGQPDTKSKIKTETEERYTAKKKIRDGILTHLNNQGIRTIHAPEDSKYRGWKTTYMNQWFRLESYTLEQVQSIQLEFRHKGVRSGGSLQPASKKIAAAISALLAPSTEPEVVDEGPAKELVAMDGVDDEKVEKAYEHLKTIFVKHFQNAMLECGQYLIEAFYGGDYILAQEKKFTGNKSLSKLIKRIQEDSQEKGDAPSRTWLYDAVNLAIDNHLYEQKILPSVYGQLGHSHKVNLTSAPNEDVKKALVEETVREKHSVARLRERIREEKQKLNSTHISLKEIMSIDWLMRLTPKQLEKIKTKTIAMETDQRHL